MNPPARFRLPPSAFRRLFFRLPPSAFRRLFFRLLPSVFLLLAACSTPDPTVVHVIVPSGGSVHNAADSLAHVQVVRSARLFRAFAFLRGRDRTIRPGTYQFRRGESWGNVLDALRAGKGIVHTITIPEGFALSQIVPFIAEKLNVPIDSVIEATGDTALLARLDVPVPTLEGYLFPDTYIFSEGTTGREAVAAMVHRFEQAWKPEWTARLDTLTLKRNDVMALASIVEKEAKLPEERPVIAGVYMNRLRAGMLLQADPTVQYALPEHQARLLFTHLKVKSPYNTYLHLGLPPGPIASPGKASIEAALYPATVPFRYFVAAADGHHEFRVTLAEHDAAVAEIHRLRDARLAQARKDSIAAARANKKPPR